MIHQTVLREDPDSPIIPESPAPLFEAASPNAIPATPPRLNRFGHRSTRNLMTAFSNLDEMQDLGSPGSPVWQSSQRERGVTSDRSDSADTASSSGLGSVGPSPLSATSCNNGALLEMLREMKESNKKLQDDLKRLSEKIDSDESGATHKKNKKATPSPEIRNCVRRVYKSLSEENNELQWKLTEMFTSKANQHVLDRVAREVKSLQPETLSSLIKDAAKTYFNSLVGLTRMRDSGKYAAKCVLQRRRNRLLRKLKCRKAALSKTSTMTDEQKKKWMPCLVPDLMSSEESDDECDGEEQSTFKVHPLLWRSDKVTAFIKKLDLKNKSSTSQQSKRMAMKRSMGLPSDRLPPDSLSDWMVKNTK